MRLVCISDTHEMEYRLNKYKLEGDILIHTGDITFRGDYGKIKQFNTWCGSLDFANVVVIAGNHDLSFESDAAEAESLLTNCTYLRDSGTEIEGVKIYGAPWQPEFCNWAFNLYRGDELKAKWDLIPNDTDILMTHGPPMGGFGGKLNRNGEDVGCWDLQEAIKRVKPAVHVYGHIHEGYGTYQNGETLCVNASTCTLSYAPTNKPITLELTKDDKGTKVEIIHE